MPAKRRLSNAVGSTTSDVTAELIMADENSPREGGSVAGSEGRRSATPEPGRKRKKIDVSGQMQQLFDFLRRYRKEDGSELCEAFIRAPKRRTDPEYYEVVSDPIDMLRIQQKLKTDEYSTLEELKADFDKLINNALAFYAKEKEENKAATEMKELLAKAIDKIEVGEDPVATLGNRDDGDEVLLEMLEELFASIITATDPIDSSRQIHMAFKLLPSKRRYPEYYQVIKDPIDLKTIATKIQNEEYREIAGLEDDLVTLTKNAMHFNEPGSQIYKDAKTLSKLIKSKKMELEVNKVARENRGSRGSRRSTTKKFFSEEIADLQYEDSESEESEEDELDYDNPLWALYGHVRFYETPSGVKLGEPFNTLPSKRELPDYYESIEDPISLNEIRKKLKSDGYPDIGKLAEDLNLMFENCKEYNRPDSRLYKEAAKLQKVMNGKLAELTGTEVATTSEGLRSPNSRISPNKDPLKKRLKALYNAVLKHKRDGIEIIEIFMEKPSREDYPDYYDVIENPIDMLTINDKINNGAYTKEDVLISDLRTMFANCRQYNEEGSDIYEDANVLEKVLNAKAREMGLGARLGRPRKRPQKSDAEKIKSLYETMRDHKDAKGRQLSIIFLKLPNPKEFPDYFEVIKHPVDFEKISTRIKQNQYASLDQCLADFVLMFDNACKFNEPDSQIYKDALTLQSLATRTCRTLHAQDDGSGIPDVMSAVQDILNYIFISMYNHQDAEERCYSDSMAEVAEHDLVDGKKVRALSLDIIKRRLDSGLYKRLDSFQRDIFAVLERARSLSRSDSQIFEDAVELQTYFIKIRDEATGNGDTLQSRALLYTLADLQKAVEVSKAAKAGSEHPEEDEDKPKVNAQGQIEVKAESENKSTTFNQQEYHIGDFVYYKDIATGEILLGLIEEIPANADGTTSLSVNRFFRPIETFHVSSRKFLENEVFRSEMHDSVNFGQVTGRCIVLPVRDYFRYKPEGFADKDIFVCESRYSNKSRSFKKMKVAWSIPAHVKMSLRPEPLEPTRVQSVFKERIEKHKEELEEIERMINNVDLDLPPNVLWNNPAPSPAQVGSTFYEQYSIPGPITLKRGDAVYVRSENGRNLIAQIDVMWTGEDGMAYFHGPWFVTPHEMTHLTSTPFYPQEAFLSTISDANPLLSVVGRAAVLETKDYAASRPTAFAENDVYICESVYDESKRMIRGSLENGLKVYEHSPAVQVDEVYVFKSPISLKKELQNQPTPQTPKYVSSAMEIDNEDSMDAPPSVASSDNFAASPAPSAAPATPVTQKKVKREGSKKVSGYLMFASEARKIVCVENKGAPFGEISRLVGEKWKKLADDEKVIYEEKAKIQNKENAAKYATEQAENEERRKQQEAAAAAQAAQAAQRQAMMNGQLATSQVQNPAQTPAALGAQLGVQAQGGVVVNGQLIQQQSQTVTGQRQPAAGVPMQKPVEPIFHTVPPRPQRLLHSEAYIKYIEGLSSDSQVMSNWEKQLNASKQNTQTDEAKLPAHWLADNGEHGTSIDALWALRDFMMTDALGVVKMH